LLILSEFRDFYDNCASHGVDITIQYRRTTSQYNLLNEHGAHAVLVKDFNALIASVKDRLPPLVGNLPLLIIGFCGKIYVGIRPKIDPKTGQIYRRVFSYPQPSTDHLVEAAMWDVRDVHKDDLKHEFQEYRFYSEKGDKTIADWMDAKGDGPVGEWVDLFQRQRAVSFAIVDKTVIIDPCLQDYRFQRVVGGVEAFQSIEMFISGVLGVSQNPMIELTDQDRIQAHGFDHKSFRKEPTKKR
jgi:hypothetical protein